MSVENCKSSSKSKKEFWNHHIESCNQRWAESEIDTAKKTVWRYPLLVTGKDNWPKAVKLQS